MKIVFGKEKAIPCGVFASKVVLEVNGCTSLVVVQPSSSKVNATAEKLAI